MLQQGEGRVASGSLHRRQPSAPAPMVTGARSTIYNGGSAASQTAERRRPGLERLPPIQNVMVCCLGLFFLSPAWPSTVLFAVFAAHLQTSTPTPSTSRPGAAHATRPSNPLRPAKSATGSVRTTSAGRRSARIICLCVPLSSADQ